MQRQSIRISAFRFQNFSIFLCPISNLLTAISQIPPLAFII
jgi:hypothetical protein